MDQQDKKNFRRGDKPAYGAKKPYNKNNGEKRSFSRDGEKKPFDGKRRFDGDKKPFNGEKKSFDGKKPYGRKPYDRKDGPRPEKKPFVPQGPSARDVALKALKNVFRDNAYAAQALDRELSNAKLSDDDRRLASSMFYFTLENRLRIQSLISTKVQSRPDPEIMDILTLAAAQILFMDKIPDHAAVDEAVKQTRKARRESMTALVNAVLRGLIRARDAGELTLPDRETEPEKYISEKYSVALPLVERLVAAYGVDLTEEIAAWKPDRHGETIRPNRLVMTNEQFEAGSPSRVSTGKRAWWKAPIMSAAQAELHPMKASARACSPSRAKAPCWPPAPCRSNAACRCWMPAQPPAARAA